MKENQPQIDRIYLIELLISSTVHFGRWTGSEWIVVTPLVRYDKAGKPVYDVYKEHKALNASEVASWGWRL